MAKNWLQEIKNAQKAERTWRQQATKCWKKYSSSSTGTQQDIINIFAPNTDILLGAIFNTMPKPDIRRRFSKKNDQDERKDKLYRAVATVADYSIQYYFDKFCMFDELEKEFKDGLITGRGVTMMTYDYDTENQDMNGQPVEVMGEQIFTVEYINYKDYLQEVADCDKNITWKARRLLLSKEEIEKEFGKKYAKYMEFEYSKDKGKEQKITQKRAEVWEIWDKKTKKRIYMAPTYENGKVMREDKDPYRLENFFPFDVYKTIDNGEDTIPTPEYEVYRGLNQQIQNAAMRIRALSDQHIKYMPVCNNKIQDDLSASLQSEEGTTVGVNSAPTVDILAQVAAIPTAEAQSISLYLENRINVWLNQIWQLTGISDIMRGSTESNETATAQKYKGIFGSLRLQMREKAVQIRIKHIYRMLAEAICQFMTIDNMKSITCLDLPTMQEQMEIRQKLAMMQQAQMMGQPEMVQVTPQEIERLQEPTWEEVAQILRDDKLRSYTVDIETTATVFDDVQEERTQAQAFSTNVMNMLNSSAAMIQASPSTIDLMEQLTLLNINSFKVGKNFTDSIKKVFANVKREVMEAQEQPQENPAVQLQQQKLALDNQKAMADIQSKNIKNQVDMRKAEAEMVQDQEKLEFEKVDKTRQTNIKQQEADRKDSELVFQAGLESQKLMMDTAQEINIPGDVRDLI